MRTKVMTLALLGALVVSGCDRGQGAGEAPEQRGPEASAQESPDAAAQAAPKGVEETARTRRSVNAFGQTRVWREGAGVRARDEETRLLFEVEGRGYVSFRGALELGDADCVIDWRGDWVDAEGAPVRPLRGFASGRAGEVVSIGALTSLEAVRASRVAGVQLDYWTRCGDALSGMPHALDVRVGAPEVASATFKGVEVPVTEVSLEPNVESGRCFAEITVQALDAEGFVLKEDALETSLGAGQGARLRIPRAHLDGQAVAERYEPLVDTTRIVVGELDCPQPWSEEAASITGVEVVGEPVIQKLDGLESAPALTLAGFTRRAKLKSELASDCTVSVTWVVLDAQGYPMHRTHALRERLELKAGATLELPEPAQPIWLRQDQVERVGRLVLAEATPARGCEP